VQPEDDIVRRLFAAIALVFASSAVALADDMAPGYTAADQAQFLKLAAGNGTWTCKDTPPSTNPDVITAKRVGNWFVWSETGDEPAVTHVRWSHTLQAYVQNEIDASGTTAIFTTKSPDPFNATWKPVFPTHVPIYSYSMTMAGTTVTEKGKYKDPKTGNVMAFESVCTKN
jgi:hypothetical protein